MDRADALSRLQSSGQYALELEAVSRHFGALAALADINLAVKAGERRAILGSNGAGKTTLFNLVTGDFPLTTGRIRFFGEDITAIIPQERIRRGLRRTYQISLLFENLSVRDNLFVACRGVSPRRASLCRSGPSDPALRICATLNPIPTNRRVPAMTGRSRPPPIRPLPALLCGERLSPLSASLSGL